MSRQLPAPRPDRNAPAAWQGRTRTVVFVGLVVFAVVFLLASIVIHGVVRA